jgi:hypothetical protein
MLKATSSSWVNLTLTYEASTCVTSKYKNTCVTSNYKTIYLQHVSPKVVSSSFLKSPVTFTSTSVEILLPPKSRTIFVIFHIPSSFLNNNPTSMASPDFSNFNPKHWIFYGPQENCTLALCPAKYSVYEYRPSLAANVSFIVLFGISLAIHLYQGFRWHKWAFVIAIFWGCVCEIVGYGGRVMLWINPFSFPGFLSQIGEF